MKRPKVVNPDDRRILDRVTFGRDGSVSFLAPDNLVYTPSIYPYNRNRALKCESHHFELPYGFTQMYYPIKKYLPQKNIIDKSYIRLWEVGLLPKMNKDYKPLKPNCYRPTAGETVKEVKIKYVDKAYHMFAVGVGVALIILGIEIVFHMKHPVKQDEKEKMLNYQAFLTRE